MISDKANLLRLSSIGISEFWNRRGYKDWQARFYFSDILFFFILCILSASMNQYFALVKHLSQYLCMIIAPSNLNSASVVAIFPQVMQNPGDFFVVCTAGLV